MRDFTVIVTINEKCGVFVIVTTLRSEPAIIFWITIVRPINQYPSSVFFGKNNVEQVITPVPNLSRLVTWIDTFNVEVYLICCKS